MTFIGQVVSEEKTFEIVDHDDNDDNGRQTMGIL